MGAAPKNKSKAKSKDKTVESNDVEISEVQALRNKWQLVPAREYPIFRQNLRVIPTGILALDMLSGEVDPIDGNGGFRQYSIVEIFGENNTYKSGSAEHIMREVSRKYGLESVVAAFSESPPYDRMRRFGLKVAEPDGGKMITIFDPFHPNSNPKLRIGEHLLDAVLEFAARPEVKVIVVDSAAAVVVMDQMFTKSSTGALKNRDMDVGDAVACRAKVWNRFLAKLAAVSQGAVLVIINQKRVHLAKRPQDRENKMRPTTPAGSSIDFGANIRITCNAVADSDPKSKFKHPITGKEAYTALKVTWTLNKLKEGRPSTLDSMTSIVDLGYYTDENGEQQQVRINRPEECLRYADYIKERIPDCDKLFTKKGNSWTLGGLPESYRSIALASAALAKMPELQTEIEKHIIKNSAYFFLGSKSAVEVPDIEGDSGYHGDTNSSEGTDEPEAAEDQPQEEGFEE